ncbi:MAG: hypothetical protein FJX25_02355 [Alphaproteobacteria bacterium]|nr:hypothetical protein [Alphaproteobacteria bacterium]
MSNDLENHSDEHLDREFDRLVKLRDEAQESIAAIRVEKSRRLDAELARLRALEAARKGGA